MKDKIMPKSEWIWMPHAAHYMGYRKCQFRLATYVGDWIVSTIGERGDKDSESGSGYEEIRVGRIYESIVFKAKPADDECDACPYIVADFGDTLEEQGYNNGREAYNGHIALCEKWSKISADSLAYQKEAE